MKTVFFPCLRRLEKGVNIFNVAFAYIHTLFILYGIPHEGQGVARNSAGNAFFDVFVSCCVSEVRKRQKIQGTYFKICALYLKIYGLYFL